MDNHNAKLFDQMINPAFYTSINQQSEKSRLATALTIEMERNGKEIIFTITFDGSVSVYKKTDTTQYTMLSRVPFRIPFITDIVKTEADMIEFFRKADDLLTRI